MNSIKEHSNFLNYTYSQPDLTYWLTSFSSHLSVKPSDNHLTYPETYALGYAKVRCIEEGFSFRLVDYKLNTDFEHRVDPSPDFHLILYFYQFISTDKIHFEVGDNIIESDAKNYKAVVMTNSRVKQKLLLKKGTSVKGLTIQLTEAWINKHIDNKNGKNYSALKQNSYLLDVLTAKAQKILNDIYCNHEESQISTLYITTRVMRLLENFLENILKRDIIDSTLSISSKDFESILKIEGLLLENYGEVFPKIEKLARLALMSESKLKKIYKQAFGMGLFEYYQKNRMHKAKELLNTGEYTVSQVGSLLGYQNLSNFSNSFKKEFNQLPRDYHQVG